MIAEGPEPRQTCGVLTDLLDYEDAAAWCSGLTRRPVKAEIGGSNPLAVARMDKQSPGNTPGDFSSELPVRKEFVGSVIVL